MARQFKKQFIQMNRSNKKFKPVGVVLHETATPGATAQAEFNYFNNGKRGASAHGFIDWIEDLQTIPFDEKGWHAKEPANSMFIGIEMCRPCNNDPKRAERMKIIYEASVDAVARIFYYVLSIGDVTEENLVSHHEATLKWKNSTHVDPTSYLKEVGKNMDIFRAAVQTKLDLMKGAK